MSLICRAVFWVYVLAGTLALLLIPASNFRLFGLEPDALAGVFAILLAQPWVTLAFELVNEASDPWNLVIVGVCLVLNAALLHLACRFFRR